RSGRARRAPRPGSRPGRPRPGRRRSAPRRGRAANAADGTSRRPRSRPVSAGGGPPPPPPRPPPPRPPPPPPAPPRRRSTPAGARVGEGRPQQGDVQRTVGGEVGGVAGDAAHEARVLEPLQAAADVARRAHSSARTVRAARTIALSFSCATRRGSARRPQSVVK